MYPFKQEIIYMCIVITLGLLCFFLHPGAGVVVWLYTYLYCRHYHNWLLSRLLKHGPALVLGGDYTKSWNYACFNSIMLREWKRIQREEAEQKAKNQTEVTTDSNIESAESEGINTDDQK